MKIESSRLSSPPFSFDADVTSKAPNKSVGPSFDKDKFVAAETFILLFKSEVVIQSSTRMSTSFSPILVAWCLQIIMFYSTTALPMTTLGRIGRNFVPSRRLSSSLQATEKQSIAIVGSGAVGGYYGARLWEAGVYDVKFQMRGEHYEKSKDNGLNVTSLHGDIFIQRRLCN
jgi:hypothetical protein